MSEIDWDNLRPPAWPEPQPPTSEVPSWEPITAPSPAVPPPPPPQTPAPPWPPSSSGSSPRGRGGRVAAAVAAALLLTAGGFGFARATDSNSPRSAFTSDVTANSGATTPVIDPNVEEPVAAVAA